MELDQFLSLLATEGPDGAGRMVRALPAADRAAAGKALQAAIEQGKMKPAAKLIASPQPVRDWAFSDGAGLSVEMFDDNTLLKIKVRGRTVVVSGNALKAKWSEAER